MNLFSMAMLMGEGRVATTTVKHCLPVGGVRYAHRPAIECCDGPVGMSRSAVRIKKKGNKIIKSTHWRIGNNMLSFSSVPLLT